MMWLWLLLQIPVRTYWPVTVAQLASGSVKHTHVELDSVRVVYTALEQDGGFHMRLRDPRDTVATHFVVAEIIPELPLRHPRVGEVISVRGISRYDGEHHWFESHPTEWISP
jgi:hypothetical protein